LVSAIYVSFILFIYSLAMQELFFCSVKKNAPQTDMVIVSKKFVGFSRIFFVI